MRVLVLLGVVLAVVLTARTALGESERKGLPLFWNKRAPPPPERSRMANTRAVTTNYFNAPVDNAQPNGPTYSMRYITNDQFFVANSSILLMVGGEWTINTGYVTGGHMFEIARDINAFLIYTEHRYYGRSQPVANSETENLKYLIVDQALQDVALLVRELKKEPRFAGSKVIVFGGSYGGNMATWIRIAHPNDIYGSVASSGPVLAKSDFYEYLETVNDAMLSEGSQKCLDTINQGTARANELLQTEEGRREVADLFATCETVDISNPLDVQTFFSIITGAFSGLVQYARAGEIAYACSTLEDDSLGEPVKRLGAYIKEQAGGSCYWSKYQDTVDYYKDTTFRDEDAYTVRLWLWQTCTEYGYYQSTSSTNQPFGDTHPVSYYEDHMCPDLFGNNINKTVLYAGIQRTNTVYQGLQPDIDRVISVHGTIDPWHRLGIVESLSEEFPAILIPGTSHCVDLQSTSLGDLPQLTAARQKIRETVLKWVNE